MTAKIQRKTPPLSFYKNAHDMNDTESIIDTLGDAAKKLQAYADSDSDFDSKAEAEALVDQIKALRDQVMDAW